MSEVAQDMTLHIPETNPNRYLTGMTALNIPTEDGKIADWHFTETFSGKARLRVAGENIHDTSQIFGNYGIRECSAILQDRGVSTDKEVYAANFVRALLDMLCENLAQRRNPQHIEVEEMLNYEEDIQEFWQYFEHLKSHFNDEISQQILMTWEHANRT